MNLLRKFRLPRLTSRKFRWRELLEVSGLVSISASAGIHSEPLGLLVAGVLAVAYANYGGPRDNAS